MKELDIALKAVQLYAETHPRPAQVSKREAARLLGISHPTVGKLVASGDIRLNRCGKIPITEIDRVLAVSGVQHGGNA